MAWTSLCELPELREDEGKYFEIDGFRLAVFLHQGKVYVLDNECPHAGGSLAGGWVDEGCAVCPWHDWAFRLTDGQLRDTPGVMVKAYQTRMYARPGQGTLVQADLPMP
jgi:nitrite reductase/ring-hydroxylating ferredoxin subunit